MYGQGEEPDARFTLANERTLLAWLRTAIALLVAGIALGSLGDHLPRAAVHGAALCLVGLATLLPAAAYLRWLRTESALRTRRALPGAGLTTALLLACAVPMVVVLVAVGLS